MLQECTNKFTASLALAARTAAWRLRATLFADYIAAIAHYAELCRMGLSGPAKLPASVCYESAFQ